ncbi:hypothetical protein FANTH_5356 [Fusarium anthophilum]|uniref:C2H2-type domain-containing protein n=1 Tax=Fusarium anthophilum TaxID=48485 RepID=A0A8H5E6T4_9HYPO|nr:hypothetical protein FANTH_5356 [Fusarium anthophilum]
MTWMTTRGQGSHCRYPDTENSDPRFYIETNLKLLAKISVAIRRSGQRLRYLKADAYLRDHLDDEEYTLLKNHLLFLILVSSYEQKLLTELGRLAINQEIPKAVEIVIRSWIIDPSRATSTQQRPIEANIIRRNRIAYARRFIGKNSITKKPQEETATTIAPSRLPGALLGPAMEASTFDTDTKEPFSIPSPVQPLPAQPEPTESLTAKTLTATELGSQFILPIIMPLEPKKGALSIVTKITQTGTNQDYPACPAKKGSFQCPYCVQVLTEDYATKSRWRGHVAQDLNPYSCIYHDCPDSHNLYTTKEEWINHIRNKHKTERWACDECIFESDHDDEFIFDSQESWANHMRSRHSCSEDRLTLLSSMSKRELNELVQCPLCKRPCGYSRPDQDDHISEHLHSWALRALPWDLNPDDEASSDSPEMGSENDLARMSEISEQTEDDVESVTATTSSVIDREVTRWSQETPIGSSRLDGLVKQLEEVIAKWTAHTWLDTQNETTLQLLLNVNQVKAQFCRASPAKLEESEFTTQQQLDIEENLCTNIELCVDYMSQVVGERDMGPSQDPEEWPNSTPFPKVEAGNVPPTDDEKEDILKRAGDNLSDSDSPAVQLAWACDVLTSKEASKNEEQLTSKALAIIRLFSLKEHPEALYRQGKLFEYGHLGHPIQLDQAMKLYHRSTELGHARSCYHLGSIYNRQPEGFEMARPYYEKAEGMGDSAASYQLAFRMIHASHGEEQDYEKELALLKQSADNADKDAPQGAYAYGMAIAGDLADFDMDECLMTIDKTRAFSYIEKSANLGYHKAQFQMGQAYEFGLLNCSKDLAKSFQYYHLAVRRGSVKAAEALSCCFFTDVEGILLPDPELSFKFARWGAVEGKSAAEYILGCHYETAEYVRQDLNKAIEWYELAMSHTSSYANSSEIIKLAHKRLARLKLKSQAFGESRSRFVDRYPSEPVSKPKTIIVGIDLGAVFSSVSWADSSNPYEINSIHDWPHAAAISASDAQVPTQYDLETKIWGNPRLQAAGLRKSVNIPPKSCFSALKDFCSSVEPTCKQAAGFLTSYIRSLWSHAVREIFSRTRLWDLAFILSLAIPVYFSSDAKNRLLRVAYDATVQNDASQVVEINVVGQMQAAILNSLKAQYRLDRSARGPSIVMENGEIVVVCDCGGTGARAISYEIHTESPPLVRQLTAWNGERIGTHSVDMEFLNYLLNHSSSNLGTSRSALAELDFFIQTEWEYGLKRTFRGDENHDIVLQLPRKAIFTLRRLQPSANELLIKPSVVRKCFEKSLMAIEKVIHAQFAALEAIGTKPNSILLVGGLAQSPYIVQCLQQKFDVMFHLPDDSSAVSRGVIEFEFQRILAQRVPIIAELEDQVDMTPQKPDSA